MQHRHRGGVLGEVQRLVDRRVAAAHHDHRLLHEERAVARRAVGDTAPHELLLARHPKGGEARAARDDQGAGGVDAAVGLDQQEVAVAADRGDLVHRDLELGRVACSWRSGPRV